MTYFEAVSTVVSREDARHEVEAHGLFFGDFVDEVGDNDEYDGADVLGWLGY